jgi:hypothetical protein
MAATVCARCKKTMKKTAIGATVAFVVNSVDRNRPYEIWSGDVWSCLDCKAEVVSQWGDGPFWRHFHPGEPPKADITITSDR